MTLPLVDMKRNPFDLVIQRGDEPHALPMALVLWDAYVYHYPYIGCHVIVTWQNIDMRQVYNDFVKVMFINLCYTESTCDSIH